MILEIHVYLQNVDCFVCMYIYIWVKLLSGLLQFYSRHSFKYLVKHHLIYMYWYL